jgi:hypothetical protein
MSDWRLPENRREAFMRQYLFHLEHKSHPGLVYSWLPAISKAYGLDEDQLAWLVWLNGNTQNPAMSLLLLEAAPRAADWMKAVEFWDDNFKLMAWDTDRRHQKARFAQATAQWVQLCPNPAQGWETAASQGWDGVWAYSMGQPYMGRLSAWSMAEYARILLDRMPDANHLLLADRDGSRSHRNGMALLAGAPVEAAWWTWGDFVEWGGASIEQLDRLARSLLEEASDRSHQHPDVSYLTLESALCTWKSWHKPNRRYPNVYADMGYLRLKQAEARFGKRFELLWAAREKDLPAYLRLEDSPRDPGLAAVKQNLYRETGTPPMLHRAWPDMANPLNLDIDMGLAPERKDPKWS